MVIKWFDIAKLNLKDISKLYNKDYALSLAESVTLLYDNNYLGKKNTYVRSIRNQTTST